MLSEAKKPKPCERREGGELEQFRFLRFAQDDNPGRPLP
jgi:hypothetical protein